jgi:hypothetical protein
VERKLFKDRTWYGPWTAEGEVTASRTVKLFRRWVFVNILLIIGRGTNLIRGLIF